jgi:hypothetical protein
LPTVRAARAEVSDSSKGNHALQKETNMNRLLKAVALALVMGFATAPAFANTYEENMKAIKAIAFVKNVKQCGDMERTVIEAANNARSKSYSTHNANIMNEVDSRELEAMDEFAHAMNKAMAHVAITDCDKLAKRAIEYINEPLAGK